MITSSLDQASPSSHRQGLSSPRWTRLHRCFRHHGAKRSRCAVRACWPSADRIDGLGEMIRCPRFSEAIDRRSLNGMDQNRKGSPAAGSMIGTSGNSFDAAWKFFKRISNRTVPGGLTSLANRGLIWIPKVCRVCLSRTSRSRPSSSACGTKVDRHTPETGHAPAIKLDHLGRAVRGSPLTAIRRRGGRRSRRANPLSPQSASSSEHGMIRSSESRRDIRDSAAP